MLKFYNYFDFLVSGKVVQEIVIVCSLSDFLPLELLTVPSRDWSVMDLVGKLDCITFCVISATAVEGRMYHCRGGKLSAKEDQTWRLMLNTARI